MTPRLTLKVKVKVRGHQVKKCVFTSNFQSTGNVDMVKGHLDQGQRSPRSMSKITWVKVSMW